MTKPARSKKKPEPAPRHPTVEDVMTAAYQCGLTGVIVIGTSAQHGLVVRSSFDFQNTQGLISTVLHTYQQRRMAMAARRECGKAWDEAVLGGFYGERSEVRE